MLCRLPVIVTDVCGAAEIITEGKTGYKVPAKNKDALADACLAVLALPIHLRIQIGNAAYCVAEEAFPLKKMISEYEALYKRLLQKSNLNRI